MEIKRFDSISDDSTKTMNNIMDKFIHLVDLGHEVNGKVVWIEEYIKDSDINSLLDHMCTAPRSGLYISYHVRCQLNDENRDLSKQIKNLEILKSILQRLSSKGTCKYKTVFGDYYFFEIICISKVKEQSVPDYESVLRELIKDNSVFKNNGIEVTGLQTFGTGDEFKYSITVKNGDGINQSITSLKKKLKILGLSKRLRVQCKHESTHSYVYIDVLLVKSSKNKF